jgi:serine/threonine-protein kinase
MAVKLEVVRQALADRYDVEQPLGHGGMCTVFRGRDKPRGADVAIKVLRPEFATSLLADRFHQEIEFLASLEHPNILPLLESDEAGALVYYVMPFATEGSLKERLARERRLSLDDALAVTRDVAAALDFAHGENVMHRDIKPGNIMFVGGRATICDFGVARAIVKAGGERLSTSGLVVGTPAYMSPEQASGASDLGHRSDIYALACLLYEMLAGEPPFTGRTAQAIMARHVKERPPSLRVVRPDVPQHVEDAIRRALAKAPEQRQASAGEFVKGLMGAG